MTKQKTIQWREILSELTASMAEIFAHCGDMTPGEWLMTPKGKKALVTARKARSTHSVANGGGASAYNLTWQSEVAKLSHNVDGQPQEIKLYQSVQYHAPHTLSGRANLCAWSTAQCRDLCLQDSGRLGMSYAQNAMKIRTLFMVDFPTEHLLCLLGDARKHAAKAHALGGEHVARFNGTSEIVYDMVPGLSDAFRSVGVDHFQDYAKRPESVLAQADPSWYFARSATERTTDIASLAPGTAVVVNVKRRDEMPETWHGRNVIDGDRAHGDLRILDPIKDPTAIVLLRAKGSALNAPVGMSQFVKPVDSCSVPK